MARDARLLAGVVAALCLSAGLAGAASGQAPPGDSFLVEHWNGAEWTVSRAASSPGGTELRAITASSPTNLWAVGVQTADNEHGSFPIAQHYTGKAGSGGLLPTPNRHAEPKLDAVSAGSAKDVWAVGSIGPHDHTLTEHFNGKVWKVVPSPQTPGTRLMGVAALTPRNAWAVGSLAVKTKNSRLLIEHWNGRLWRQVLSPNPKGPEEELLAISARSARDIWAVGDHRAGGHTRTLVLHWNGRRWTQVPSPSPAAQDSSFWGVTAIGAKDAWAVGVRGTRALAEHWNGRSWRVVPVGTPAGSTAAFLRTVSASSSADVWAAGQYGYRPAKGLVEHWNGRAWAPASIPAARNDSLFGIAAPSARDVWAVGGYEPGVEGLR